MPEQQLDESDERLGLPSASKLATIVACPGQPNLERTLPPEAFEKEKAEDEWATAGTRIHDAFETGNTLELSEEEAQLYENGVKYEKRIVEQWMDDKVIDDCEEGPREMRIWLHDPLNFPELLGSMKIDRHYYNKERGLLLITDLKNGWNPNLPTSARSWQLKFGAVACWREDSADWVKEVRVGYCKSQDEYTVLDFCDYSEMDLKYSWESIRFHLWESSQPDAPRHPGPHCTFCPCKPYCMEAGAYAMMPTVIARNALGVSAVELQGMVDKMVPADLYRIWDASTIITKIMNAVKMRLKKMSEEELMNLGIVKGKGVKRETVINMPDLLEFLFEHFTEESVLPCLDMGKGKMVELIRAGKGYNKAMAEEWYASKLAPFLKVEPGDAPLRRLK